MHLILPWRVILYSVEYVQKEHFISSKAMAAIYDGDYSILTKS